MKKTKKESKEKSKKIDIKSIWNKIIEWLKKFFSSKRNIIITGIVVAIIVVLLIALNSRKQGSRFALDEIYDASPEEVRKLYSNIVSVGCQGDLHFDIDIDKGPVELKNINHNNLIDYTLSYMEKNNLLSEDTESVLFRNAESILFAEKQDLIRELKDYNFGEYTYNVKGNKIIREKRECQSDITYVSHLFGYSFNKKELSIDVNVSYMKNGILYNFDNKELGKYDGDKSKLSELTENTSYYRLVFVKDNGSFLLTSIEWKHRS